MTPLDSKRREEIGARRRQRTRTTIVTRGLDRAAQTPLDELTIDDFIEAAGVARGTFYNHFRTKEALLVAMAHEVVDSLDAQLDHAFEGVENPAQRMATAIREFTLLGRTHPERAWVLVRATPEWIAGWSEGMQRGIVADLEEGAALGVFHIEDPRAALAIATGALREGIRATLRDTTEDGFSVGLAALTLRALGVEADAAKAVLREVFGDSAVGVHG